MLGIITLIGLIIAVILVLNLASAKNIKNPGTTGNQQPVRERVDVKKYLNQQKETAAPQLRICPVCGSFLEDDEYLIAALDPMERNGQKRQAQIYGCPRCFVTDGVNLESRKLTRIEP